MEWDRLTEEARLRADMAAQLVAAKEREAEACRDAEEIHGMFEDLKARSKLEEEEAARILKERDGLSRPRASWRRSGISGGRPRAEPWPFRRRWTRTLC